MFGNNLLSFNVVKESDKILSGSPELKRMLVDSQDDFIKMNKCDDALNACQTISTIVEKSK